MSQAKDSWQTRFVASMCQSKRLGYSFETAVKIAFRDCEPRGRDVDVFSLRLFDESGRREETVAEALVRFCGQAWRGEKPALRHFSLDMLRVRDDSRPAGSPGRIRTAA